MTIDETKLCDLNLLEAIENYNFDELERLFLSKLVQIQYPADRIEFIQIVIHKIDLKIVSLNAEDSSNNKQLCSAFMAIRSFLREELILSHICLQTYLLYMSKGVQQSLDSDFEPENLNEYPIS